MHAAVAAHHRVAMVPAERREAAPAATYTAAMTRASLSQLSRRRVSRADWRSGRACSVHTCLPSDSTRASSTTRLAGGAMGLSRPASLFTAMTTALPVAATTKLIRTTPTRLYPSQSMPTNTAARTPWNASDDSWSCSVRRA